MHGCSFVYSIIRLQMGMIMVILFLGSIRNRSVLLGRFNSQYCPGKRKLKIDGVHYPIEQSGVQCLGEHSHALVHTRDRLLATNRSAVDHNTVVQKRPAQFLRVHFQQFRDWKPPPKKNTISKFTVKIHKLCVLRTNMEHFKRVYHLKSYIKKQ